MERWSDGNSIQFYREQGSVATKILMKKKPGSGTGPGRVGYPQDSRSRPRQRQSLARLSTGNPERDRFGQSDSGVVTSGYLSPGEPREFFERRSGTERDQFGLTRTPNVLSQTRERTPAGTLAVYPYAGYR